MTLRETTAASVHFGPQSIDAIPVHHITELEQVRTTYDHAALEDLASAITLPQTDTDTTHFHLQHPVIVARFSTQAGQHRYVHDHADFFRLDGTQRVRNLADASDTILIAGHRRRRAIGILAARHGFDLTQATVAASVHEDPRFGEALGSQLRENVHEKPSAQDEARAIHYYFEDTCAVEQHPPTVRRIARELGFSESKVRDALSFASLPDDVQQLTHQHVLPFSTVRQLKSIYDAYLEKYQPSDAHDALMSDVARLLRTRLAGSETRARQWIATRTQEIRAESAYQQGVFFELESSPRARRDAQSARLAEEALRILKYQLATGDLMPEALRELIPDITQLHQKHTDEPPELNYA